MRRAVVLAVVAVMVGLRCASGAQPEQSNTAGPRVLGAQPWLSLSPDGGVPALDAGFTRFALWVTARDVTLDTVPVDPEALRVSCEGLACTPDARRVFTGANEGVLAIIVDGSGSNSANASRCTGCPTDPGNQRGAAVKALVTRLSSRAPRWHVGLFDFGQPPPATFLAARQLAGYTQYPEDLIAAANRLEGQGGTPLYDAVFDVVPTVAGERRFINAGDLPARVLVVSDGEDTSSTKTLVEALNAARDAGVSIDVVGYGNSDGGVLPLLAGKAYRDLRLLASQTGGFATFAQSAQLPALFEHLADAYRVGFAEVQAPAPSPTFQGRVTLGSDSAPFTIE